MATVVIADNPKIDAERFDQVDQKLRQSGDFPPAGLIFIVAGEADSGWRVISVWKSRDDFERFASERLAPAWSESGVSRDDVNFTIYEAHSFVAGDLSGAAQPAISGAQSR
jgi:hypothetical protein